MNSDENTVGQSGSTNNTGEIQHSLGLILGQLAYLSHLPEKIDKLNREIGELKARLDILSKATDHNTEEITKNSGNINRDDGASESRKVVVSYLMSIGSLTLSAILVILAIFSSTTPTP
jgi:hypothetical protein